MRLDSVALLPPPTPTTRRNTYTVQESRWHPADARQRQQQHGAGLGKPRHPLGTQHCPLPQRTWQKLMVGITVLQVYCEYSAFRNVFRAQAETTLWDTRWNDEMTADMLRIISEDAKI